MAFRANQQLRDDMWDYRYKSATVEDENVLKFASSAPNDHGASALNLVQQAADMFSNMENRAREIEARAQAMCESLTGKLQLAEKQRDASERARREVVNEMNGKLQEVAKALQQAQSRIVVAEDRAVAAEFRAQSAEAQLYKANRELAAIEEAIRTRLL
jgi:methionine synthase II (cobalamin-independent)